MAATKKRNPVLARLKDAFAAFGGGGNPVQARHAMKFEALEARILHSADLGAGLVGDAPAMPQVEQRVLESSGEFATGTSQAEQTQKLELVFIDAATPDQESLLRDIAAQAGERRMEVIILDGNRNGIDQITQALGGCNDIAAVHLISHGSDGAIQLGSAVLDSSTLGNYSERIQAWSRSFAQEADILIYGCNVAASGSGQALVTALAGLTGADVAASDDLTGSLAKGGDWQLEYAAGRIETGNVLSAQAQAQWAGLLANSSPVLAGANNLGGINEDAGGNPGTLVSALIAGQVTDADGGPQGIAVVAVDNTNGTWQYSTNSGGSWNAFGTPSATSARLLAADGSTYVRFVPNANWNGTVNNGLTFRAWDQTSGTTGATADTTETTSTVLDSFNVTPVTYTENDGTVNWSSGWVDGDGNPAAGAVSISGQSMRLQTVLLAGPTSIYRSADLTGASSATLTLDYDNQILLSVLGDVSLQVSGNGGGSYTTLATFSSAATTGNGSLTFNIDGFISADTRVQLVVSGGITVVQSLFVDNIQIEYKVPLSSGVTAFSSATASSSITVAPVNDAPAGTGNTVTTAEDTPYVFTAADFGYTDPGDVPPNTLLAVRITTLPGGGTLTANGIALTAGDFVTVGDINAGLLVYTPPAGTAGTGVGSFTFQVQDDGGGADLDTVARAMSVDVTAINDAPAGSDGNVTATEDTAYVFTATDFGYSDPDDVPANTLLAVKITTLPATGALTLNGIAVATGQFISITDIDAGNLAFTPAANANGTGYATLRFQVQDDGGTGGGGIDLDPTARTLTIDVTAVNDAPAGANTTVTTAEDTGYAFSAADFGFSDPGDVPASALLAVRITTLPGAGTLSLGGIAVNAGDFIDVADIDAGLLVFTPAGDANGTGYATFTFQVRDDGGGTDLAAAANTLSIDVTAANDAPVLTDNNGVTVSEGGFVTIDTGMLHASDADNTLAQLAYTVNVSALNGHLELATAPGVAISSFTQDDIANNRLVYVHDGSETTSDGFSFTVSDGAGGSIASTAFSIAVNAANDAPTATLPGAQSTVGNATLVLSTANGNALVIGDPDAGASPVEITASVVNGTLTLSGTAGLSFVTGTGSGDISMRFTGTIAAINAALDGLAFTADNGYSGSTLLSLDVDDLGNSGSGGALSAGGSVVIAVATPPVVTTPGTASAPGTVFLDDPFGPPVVKTPELPGPGNSGSFPPAASDGEPEGDASGSHAPEASPAEETSADPSAGSTPAGRAAQNTLLGSASSQSSHSGRGSNAAFGSADLRMLFAVADQPEITAGEFSLASLEASLPDTSAQSAMQSQGFLDELDRLRDGLQDESRVDFNTVALTTAASLGLSVGYVLWLLRGGVLVSSVLSSLPAWRFVDPLPILGRLEEDDEDNETDESLESMVVRGNRATHDDEAGAQPA